MTKKLRRRENMSNLKAYKEQQTKFTNIILKKKKKKKKVHITYGKGC